MNSFTDGFWSLFIIVMTLGGIGFCYWLVRWTSGPTAAPGEEVKTMGHVWDEDLEELNNPLPRWWLIMFYITIVFGVLYLMLYPGLGSGSGFLNWSSTGEYEAEMQAAEERYGPIFEQFSATPVEELANNPDALRVGGRLYASYCAGCHGSYAEGGPGFPNLRDEDWLWGGDGAAIKVSILNGRQAAMPAWLEPLGGEAGVNEVTQYVRSLSGLAHEAPAAQAGKPKYIANCQACHGAKGEGNPVFGAPNLRDEVWLYGGTVAAIQASIAKGRSGQMPAQSQTLGEAKSHVLAAYVYSLSKYK